MNESLASYFAIEGARRFVGEKDRVWLDRFFLSPRTGLPLIEAQRRYAAGAVDQGAAFYADGPAFWREIDADEVARFLDRYSAGTARPIVLRYLTSPGSGMRQHADRTLVRVRNAIA